MQRQCRIAEQLVHSFWLTSGLDTPRDEVIRVDKS